ncbi:MAG: ATP-binding cassette domain-containing protein [Oscillospiraceae bacterium]|jgi:putative ABC transport system ATP-binding protein|nr:ATP-binding cassette domain-containing protein [Oscillospiraceae bacterium]
MLELENIKKVFFPGTINERIALQNLNLTVSEGEFVTVIGENGAGKSTMLNVISGVHPADGGRILLDGEDISRQKEYKRSRHIGRVFQDPLKGTAFDMTIEENLSIALGKGAARGLTPGIPRAAREMFRERLSLLGIGLEQRMKHKVGLLSGGQRQALTLLMATIVRPKLLLLDEHTAALDPGAADTVNELTTKIVTENNIATLMVTHNMSSALAYGTRTIMMSEGTIVLDVSGAERGAMTVADLIAKFAEKKGRALDDDKLLLS